MSQHRQIGLALGLGLLVVLGWAATKARTQTAGPPPLADLLSTNKPSTQILGSISGRVMHDDGTPAAGVAVTAYAAVQPFLRYDTDNPNTTVTGADGRYTITLRPFQPTVMNGPALFNGTHYKTGYTVFVGEARQSSVDPRTPYIQPPPQDVDPALRPDHALTLVDFVLRLGPQITVRAQDAITGAPLPGVSVTARNQISMSAAMGVTGPDGFLRFRVPDTQFELEAQLPDGVQAAPGTEVYHQVTASPGQEVPWDINVYGGTLKNDWHGLVMGPNGKPAPGVAVTIRRPYASASNLVTDAQGRFSASLYRMGSDEGPMKYDSHQPLVVAQKGDLVAAQVVTPDESWHGMTLRLAPGAALTGTLTGPSGRPAAHVGIMLDGWLLNGLLLSSTQGSFLIPGTTTDDRGRFTLDGLPPGQYQVVTHGGGFGDVTVPAKVSSPRTVQPYLALAAGQRRDVGRITVPRADRTLAGTVVDTQGHLVSSLWVGVTGTHTRQTAATQADGTFRVYDLVDEPLTVLLSGTKQMTVQVPAGQATVHIVVPDDGFVTPAVPVVPRPSPSGPVTVLPAGVSTALNGLALIVRSDGAASIIRPDAVDFSERFVPPPAIFPDPPSGQIIWQGTREAVDGMRLVVHQGHGTLTDRAGRTLWSGVVVDPPDYTVSMAMPRPGVRTVTVRDQAGRTLWSGPTAADLRESPVSDGSIRVIAPDHTVAWERAVPTTRVFQELSPSDGTWQPGWRTVDATITLHVTTATGTLRAAGGQTLWSGPAPVVMTTVEGLPPMPPWKTGGQMTPALRAWMQKQMGLPHGVSLLEEVQNAPHGAMLTFQDAQGRPLPVTVGPFQ